MQYRTTDANTRWHVAGRLVYVPFTDFLVVWINFSSFSDVLTELLSVHQGETPEHAPFKPNKRPRDTRTQAEQPTGPTSPDSVRPLKSWPTRQPKAWPPSPPTLNKESSSGSSEQYLKGKGPTPDANHNPTAQTLSPLLNDNDPSMTRFPQTGYVPVEPGWDLNHLLLAQMNFGGTSQFPDTQTVRTQVYPNSSTSTAGSAAAVGSPNGSYSMSGAFPPRDPSSLPLMSPFTLHNQPVTVTQDMAAMWSDAPSNFK